MSRVIIPHAVTLPDPVRIARFLRAPELGPRLLFFSGGTALRELSRELVRYTHNSIHLITPFDSGGSSAKLRKTFHMLAVGDIRNRLMALADRSLQGNHEIYALFSHRLPGDAPQHELEASLRAMIDGHDPLVAAVPDPMRKIIRTHLQFFYDAMRGSGFDLQGASIGNLILAGGYFNYNRQIDPVIYMFTMLVKARGIVRPIINQDLTLVAEMEGGGCLAGQHRLTGKHSAPISRPVQRVYLSRSQEDLLPVTVEARRKVKDVIESAELICYPTGSFYSSLVANLLVKGVGDSIAQAQCPKVFVPNPAGDPEQFGLSLGESVRRLLRYLRESCSQPLPTHSLLNYVLLDTRLNYQPPVDLGGIESLGVTVITADMARPGSADRYEDKTLAEILLSMA